VNQQDTTIIQFKLPVEWEQDKNDMGVAGTEWVRRMVRLGRRQYGLPYDPDASPEMNGIKTEQDEESETDFVRQFLLANLSTDEYLEIEDLIDLIGRDIDQTLQELEDQDIVDSSYQKGVKLVDDWQEKVDVDG
jgi:hypothetical protein